MDSVKIRPARAGEEGRLAEIDILSFCVPDEKVRSFYWPGFQDHKEYFIRLMMPVHARQIAENRVACATVDVDGIDTIVGFAAWQLPKSIAIVDGASYTPPGEGMKEPVGCIDHHRRALMEDASRLREKQYFTDHLVRKGFVVLPAWQKKGIATQLCSWIQAIAIQHGLPIGVTAYENSASLHERLGYRTLEHLVIRDDRQGFEEFHYYFQEWTASDVARP